MMIEGVTQNAEDVDINPSQALARWNKYRRDKLALDYEGTTYTFGELHDKVRTWAAHFEEMGVRQGDRIAYLGMNSDSFLLTMFASWWLGATFMPMNFRLSAPEVSQLLLQGSPHTVVIEGPFLDVAKHSFGIERQHVVIVDDDPQAPVEGRIPLYWQKSSIAFNNDGSSAPRCRQMGMKDLALLLFTSGTTGLPKGVQLTFGAVWWNSVNVNAMVDTRVGDVNLAAAPLFHIGALNSFTVNAFVRGNTTIVHRGFNPESLLNVIEQRQVNSAFLVPAQLDAMLKSPAFDTAKLDSLRATICAGAPVPPVLIRKYMDKGIYVQQAWGLTETAPFATYLPADMTEDKIGSCGIPMPHTEVKLVDPDTGQDVKEPHTPGEMWVRGPNIATGYWNNPEITQQSYTSGWFHSGDIGTYDEDGYFYVVDRLKDLIITGGENVFPAEVERVLAEMPKVRESAVVGYPDEHWGEMVVAVIRPEAGEEVTLEEVRAFCDRHLARYKLPKHVILTEEIPRNSGGKINKMELRLFARETLDALKDAADV